MGFGLELDWLVWVSVMGSGGDWIFFCYGFAGFCFVFFFFFFLIWAFGSDGILVGSGLWWRGGHGGGDWVVWLLRERHRGNDKNERKRSDR